MIRVISNTICPYIEQMNNMVGKVYENYQYTGINNKYVRIEDGFIFRETDVTLVENEEDEQFRRSLLDTI